LYEVMHNSDEIKLSAYNKLTILIQVAKILNTFHCLQHKTWAHGHLTPHNVFIELPKNDIETEVRV
jgi:hypothetical protein